MTDHAELDVQRLRKVAHDLRNVLVGLQGIASDLEATGGPTIEPLVRELISTAALANRLSRLLLRPDADVDAAIGCRPARVLQRGRAMIERVAAPVPIVMDVENTRSIAMPGDSFLRVVTNVISNARDAIGPVGAIHLRLRAIVAPERTPTDWIELLVDDDGSRGSDSNPGTGTGLGLAIVRGLVDWAGGSVDAVDGDGAGWRTRIRVPTIAR